MLWEREPSRSRFIKSFCRGGLNRPVSVDILNFQNWRPNGRTDSSRTAFHKLRVLRSLFCSYVSNSESRQLSPKIFASRAKQLKFLSRLKIACQDFFQKKIFRRKEILKMSEAFWMQNLSLRVVHKLNCFSVCGNLPDLRKREIF
jgi:hypothetical protein